MITMNIYELIGEKNRVDKTNYLNDLATLTGDFIEEASKTNPVIKVDMSHDIDPDDFNFYFNYFRIAEWDRYYYVTEISFIDSNFCIVRGHLDVLHTNRNKIKLQYATIARNEFEFDNYLIDDKVITRDNPIIETLEVPTDVFVQAEGSGFQLVFPIVCTFMGKVGNV